MFAAVMPPNPKCIVCSAQPEVVIKVDTGRVTVKQFRDDVLIKALNMIEPDVTVDSKGVILISSEEGETDCNNDKTLAEMDVIDGCILKADDFFQSYELRIVIVHKEVDREGALFEVIADPDTLKASEPAQETAAAETAAAEGENGAPDAKKARTADDADVAGPSGSTDKPAASTGAVNDVDSDDDICIVEEDDDDVAGVDKEPKGDTRKRRTEEEIGEPSSKRAKVDAPVAAAEDDDDLILIDDD